MLSGTTTLEREMLTDRMYSIIEEFEGNDPDLIMRMYGLTEEGKKESYSVIQESYPGISRQYLKDLKERSLKVLQEKMAR